MAKYFFLFSEGGSMRLLHQRGCITLWFGWRHVITCAMIDNVEVLRPDYCNAQDRGQNPKMCKSDSEKDS